MQAPDEDPPQVPGPTAPAATVTDDDDDDLAPRPRAGFKSAAAPGISTTSMAALFAGVVRAIVGLLGFFASLMMLPVHQATPILAGVSVLLVVTGNVSAWRAIEGSRALRIVFRVLAGLSLATLLGITAATAVWGAGALRPKVAPPEEGPPTVRFEMSP